ncbi:leucine zipper putative tumor suppressor 2 homolog [Aplochiton taeniatus]
MGSVSSLISDRYQELHCQTVSEFRNTKPRRFTQPTSCFRLRDNSVLCGGSSLEQLLIRDQALSRPQLLPPHLPTKKQPWVGDSSGVAGAERAEMNGNDGFLRDEGMAEGRNDNLVLAISPCSDSEEHRDKRGLTGNLGPPPKIIPVSGQLDKNMKKALIRPTAFKPVVPKNHESGQYLSPQLGGANLSEKQGSLDLFLPVRQNNGTKATSDSSWSDGKRNLYGCGCNGQSSQPCSMSDSGRNSLSSLPTHSSLAHTEGSSSGSDIGRREGSMVPGAPGLSLIGTTTTGGESGGIYGHCHSDSGRSSSGKSTGVWSLCGHGQYPWDGRSCGRSPAPLEGYERVVRALEEKLRDRDLELQQLRENLDENEAAICQVYEEKQLRCEREMAELRQSCSTQMKLATLKEERVQQVLQLQVFQLQQEKKKLQEDFSTLLEDRESLERRCTTLQLEQTQLEPRLEETKWEVCQKSGEISLLKQKLKENQSELRQRSGDAVVLKAQLRQARLDLQDSHACTQEAQMATRTRSLELVASENELQRSKSEAELLRERVAILEEEAARLCGSLMPGGQCFANKGQCMSLPPKPSRGTVGKGVPSPSTPREVDVGSLLYEGESDQAKALRRNTKVVQGLRQQVDMLKAELIYEKRNGDEERLGFENDRLVWQEEKEKVICYQKQLQQNYIQIYRRNRDLERVMKELSLELGNRDLEEYDVLSGSTNIPFDEIAVTEI